MDPRQAIRELEAAKSDPDFRGKSAEITDSWVAQGFRLEVVESVLRFMESNPDLDYGMPGALVHFVERFHRQGYEKRLLDSLGRHPTWITTWMLNRLLNGTVDLVERGEYLRAMYAAANHPMSDARTREQARRFLGRTQRT